MQSSAVFGFLNVNKSGGMTAHDVVAAVRKIVKQKQVGHAGTLDPMATGVLPVAVGRACRLLRFLDHDKEYVAEILLGQTTDTDDVEGKTLSTSSSIPAADEVRSELLAFSGEITQTPPLYSAVKVGGQRLYAMARAGEAPAEIPERKVTVYEIEILNAALPLVKARIRCSGGTYIRSIARDLGQRLGCGGCLKSLVRTQAGQFRVEQARTLDELRQAALQETLQEFLVEPQDALKLSRFSVDDQAATNLRQGKQLLLTGEAIPSGLCQPNEQAQQSPVMALFGEKLVAICRPTYEESGAFVRIQPEVVIADG